MKNFNFFLLIILLVNIFACKDDDHHHSSITYKYHIVDFFNTHKDYRLIPAQFETVTEQYLEKPAHLEGATFDMVTEQTIVMPGYTKIEIKDSTTFHIVANSKTDSVTEINCYTFYDEEDFIEIDVPEEHGTIIKYQLAQQGTGTEVPATYKTVTREYLVSPLTIIQQPNTQEYKRVFFKLPEGRTIQAHLGYSLQQYGIEHCTEGHSYRIVE